MDVRNDPLVTCRGCRAERTERRLHALALGLVVGGAAVAVGLCAVATGHEVLGATVASARALDVRTASRVAAGGLVAATLALRAASVLIGWRAGRACAPPRTLAQPYRGAPPTRCRRHAPARPR